MFDTVELLFPEPLSTKEFTFDLTSLTVDSILLSVEDISSLEQPANENIRTDAQAPTIRIFNKRLVFKIITPKIFSAIK